MKIGMMSAWNTDSGVSIHAELVGREWIKMGHDLTVFTFIKDDYHGECLTRDRDENFVIRCFGTSTNTGYLNPTPIITRSYDVLVVQDLRMLPYDKISMIYPVLRKKSKAMVHVFHENHLPEEPWFYQIDWDAVIYFDKRQDFIKDVYENSYYIPFPCAPWREENQEKARRELGLPNDKKIVLVFAQRGYKPYIPIIDKECSNILFLILCNSKSSRNLEVYSRIPHVEVRIEDNLTWQKLDKYSHASDAIILHKFENKGIAVVSSTAFQLLGTGRPILAPKHSDYFHPLKDVVVFYENLLDLGNLISRILEDDSERKKIISKAKRFVEENSAEIVAKKYIKLFEKLIGE